MNDLSAPLHVDFSITGRGQLRCSYCSAVPLGAPDVPYHPARALISELSSIGTFSILLTGGEPTIHRQFLEIASHASKLISNITVNTNGIRLADPKFREQIQMACPHALIAISLDAADPTLSDTSRGQGGRLAITAIDECSRMGLRLCISSVLTEATVNQVPLMLNRFFPAVKMFRFFPRTPRTPDELEKTASSYFDHVERIYATLHSVSEKYPGVKILTPIGDLADRKTIFPGNRVEPKCICPQTRAFIDSDLTVYPCFYSATKINALGVYPEASFSDIWQGTSANMLRFSSKNANLCSASLRATTVPIRYIEIAKRINT